MIDHRLKSVSESATLALPAESHLDEDTISAFVEGRMGTAESRPVLSHLTTCGVCRRASAHLLQLENQIEGESEPEQEEPGRLQAFLSNLQSLVPSNEEVVFAYENPEDEEAEPSAAQTAKGEENKTRDKS
jgi:hypothetical protein